jgi:hypothetical protein
MKTPEDEAFEEIERIQRTRTRWVPVPKPEQEPVAFINVEKRSLEWVKPISWHTPTTVNLPNIPLYTTPPQRTWAGLTDEEIDKAWRSVDYTVPWEQHRIDIAQAIEQALKEKNNG